MVLQSEVDHGEGDVLSDLDLDHVDAFQVVVIVVGVVRRCQSAPPTSEVSSARPDELAVATADAAAVVHITTARTAAAAAADADFARVVNDGVSSPEPAADNVAV